MNKLILKGATLARWSLVIHSLHRHDNQCFTAEATNPCTIASKEDSAVKIGQEIVKTCIGNRPRPLRHPYEPGTFQRQDGNIQREKMGPFHTNDRA